MNNEEYKQFICDETIKICKNYTIPNKFTLYHYLRVGLNPRDISSGSYTDTFIFNDFVIVVTKDQAKKAYADDGLFGLIEIHEFVLDYMQYWVFVVTKYNQVQVEEITDGIRKYTGENYKRFDLKDFVERRYQVPDINFRYFFELLFRCAEALIKKGIAWAEFDINPRNIFYDEYGNLIPYDALYLDFQTIVRVR